MTRPTSTSDAVVARLRECTMGPTRFMAVLSCFELGIVDLVRERPGITAAELGEAVGAKADAVEQLLLALLKEGFVEHDSASGGYRLDGLAEVDEGALERVLALMDMVKVCALRQLFNLTESVRTRSAVGLREIYGFHGNLYDAMAVHSDLRESWSAFVASMTGHIDPWYFANIDIPAGARVLDVAGNTGLGAILAYQSKKSPGLHVTTFDLPSRREACLANFRAHGVAEHCSFIGGDVFEKIPDGFDVVLMTHFLALFDRDEVLKIFEGVHQALDDGGRINLMVGIYPEDFRDSDTRAVDFYPAFFLGATMGQGGPQKLSTYRRWLEDCGFTVTKVVVQDPADVAPEALSVRAIICATKTA